MNIKEIRRHIPWRLDGGLIGSRDWFYPEVLIGRSGYSFRWVGANSQMSKVRLQTQGENFHETLVAFEKATREAIEALHPGANEWWNRHDISNSNKLVRAKITFPAKLTAVLPDTDKETTRLKTMIVTLDREGARKRPTIVASAIIGPFTTKEFKKMSTINKIQLLDSYKQ